MTRPGSPAPPPAYTTTFGDPDWQRRFDAIAKEARERGLDPFAPEEFARIAESRAALKLLLSGDEDVEVRTQLGALLFQGWHFNRWGEDVVRVASEDADVLVHEAPPPDWQMAGAPAGGYVWLPRGTFVVPGNEAGPRIWMDGFFWARGHGRLILLAVLAAGDDFTLLPLPPLPVSVAGLWARESVRQDGADFAPGPGEPGPYGIAVAGEMLKLAIRVLRTLGPGAPEAKDQGHPGGPEHPTDREETPPDAT